MSRAAGPGRGYVPLMAEERVQVEVEGRQLTLSNLAKVLYPDGPVHARPRSSTTTPGSRPCCSPTSPTGR